MPHGLNRYYGSRDPHFITCSCYRRRRLLNLAHSRDVFERALEQVRLQYGFTVIEYVVMPEHFHLLISEPKSGDPSKIMHSLKLKVAKRLLPAAQQHGDDRQAGLFPEGPHRTVEGRHFWQKRFYDFNVWTARKEREKLVYMHRNPVKRGLVGTPEAWRWSSYRAYAFREKGTVKIN